MECSAQVMRIENEVIRPIPDYVGLSSPTRLGGGGMFGNIRGGRGSVFGPTIDGIDRLFGPAIEGVDDGGMSGHKRRVEDGMFAPNRSMGEGMFGPAIEGVEDMFGPREKRDDMHSKCNEGGGGMNGPINERGLVCSSQAEKGEMVCSAL